MEIVLGILFLTFSNINIQFVRKKVSYRFYITAQALLTTKQVEFINKKEYIRVVLNKKLETNEVDITALKILLAKMSIYLS